MYLELLIVCAIIPPLVLGLGVGYVVSVAKTPRARIRRVTLLSVALVLLGGILAGGVRLLIDQQAVSEARDRVTEPATERFEYWGPFVHSYQRVALPDNTPKRGSTMSQIVISKGEILFTLSFGMIALPFTTFVVSGFYLIIFGMRKPQLEQANESGREDLKDEPEWLI